MKGKRTAYICCVYFGERRSPIERYLQDRLCLLKEQIKTLETFKHSLDRIVFVFNLEKEHSGYFTESFNLIPKKIQNTQVDIIKRENIGLSYGAWSEAFGVYNSEFDYYIFNEDDYFLNDHNFDTYLVNKFNSYNNIGFLAALVGNPQPSNRELLPHAANSFGVSSYEVLKKLFDKFGKLPTSDIKYDDMYDRYDNDGQLQIAQSGEIFKLGYDIFDIREDYYTPHDMGISRPDEYSVRIIENYFHWNSKSLIVPASIQFGEPTFSLNIIDPQFQKKRSCYIINFYFGERRKFIPEYDDDKLTYLRIHLQTLFDFPNNLDKIIFNFNVEKEHYPILNEAIKLIPKKIRNTEIQITIRENVGMSYGAFSELALKEKDNFDYFIFNEDDYFLIQPNWDEYLIRKFNQNPDTGYFCAFMREPDNWNNHRCHAGHCFGITNSVSLQKVYDVFGKLPCDLDTNNYKTQEDVQIRFSNCFESVGLKIYDIREEYRLGFAMTEQLDRDIWRLFWWNDKDLIVPALLIFGKAHLWWESFDGPFQKRTNL